MADTVTRFPTPVPASANRRQLRRTLRQRRRALSDSQQRAAARGLIVQLMRYFGLSRARHIGLYLPNDGEVDPRAFIEQARRRRLSVYLPVLHPVLGNQLWFYRLDPRTRLRRNRFGIPEPARRNAPRRAPWALDAVLMPLVGFDDCGGRLGMGGGFYDRTFAFKRQAYARPPALIGLAHDEQEVESLPVQTWDVPMSRVITPTRQIVCQKQASGTGNVAGKTGVQRHPRLRFGRYPWADRRQGRRRLGRIPR
ncbi:5-formyltetrahydrofolate cyclo-ligase [Marinobacter bohaiensis]|uniref:5-formyltetrahydrofolate cyclo-ligase n=1 Tax=Marinobacter bohaiensis TaxID=2201898 RepID=UPI000DAC0AF9|nr:5-formyltetrahydrofolate cyclo-ligase [Marinobacter bohaiensis]